jgi:glycosyltransferase involved in cell wall biosynthesis
VSVADSRDEGQRGERLPITAIVLTLNEERNLPACLDSVVGHLNQVFILDCGSTDATRKIAEERGCRFFSHPWRNYGDQFQWALENLPISTDWVMRLDADERWLPESFPVLADSISTPDVAGVEVRMRIMFLGRWLKHGGLYPNRFLRVFRKQGASIEQRWMDEHIRVAGKVLPASIDVIEENYDRQRNLGLWTTKHNSYSTREAVDTIILTHGLRPMDSVASLSSGPTARKRWLKERVYARMPLFVRPFGYFLYRYFLRLGFLDGIPGFLFSVLQAFWYRFLVDAKVYQLESEARRLGRPIAEVIRDTYGITP